MIKFKVTTLNNMSCLTHEADFRTVYTDGKTIRAKEETLGYFLFNKKKYAVKFLDCWAIVNSDRKYKIKRVRTLDRGKRPSAISFLHMIRSFYNSSTYRESYNRYRIPNIPPGTICHHKIKVLGDCKSTRRK